MTTVTAKRSHGDISPGEEFTIKGEKPTPLGVGWIA
jgi:hypothetical protein